MTPGNDAGRIAILGTGLIGGSLGLVWKERCPEWTVLGHDRPEVLDRAEERGAIDEKAADPLTACKDADVVVLATPVGRVLRLMDEIADVLQPGTIVTDVASVKTPVMEQAGDVLPDDVHYVGGHPMAGAERSGIDAADPLLFENAIYALCLPEGVSEEALDGEAGGDLAPVRALVEATGARPLVLAPERHDRIAATVSHLPQVLAVALVNVVAEVEDDVALKLAAGGFRDVTRIASSPFDMWRDVLVGNEGRILDALAAFARKLQQMRNRLIEGDLEGLEEAFEAAQDTRATIPKDVKGFLDPLYDVLVRAEDQPGELHRITGVLLEDGLNVRDVELLKFREGTGGTFRLGFDAPGDADAAVEALSEADFKARRLE